MRSDGRRCDRLSSESTGFHPRSASCYCAMLHLGANLLGHHVQEVCQFVDRYETVLVSIHLREEAL